MIKGAPEGSREGLGLYDVVDFEDQERVFDAVMQTSVLGEEQKSDQKRAEILLSGEVDKEQRCLFFFLLSDLAKQGMGGTGRLRRQSCCQSLCKIICQISSYFLHSSTGQRGNKWDYFKATFPPTYLFSRKIVKKLLTCQT